MNPFLAPSRVRAALRSLELRPTRGMGQNFLVDPQTLATIVAAADLTTTDTVVEVGPGLGVLTWELVRVAGQVISVELDRRLAARLHEEFAGEQRLRIVEGDILNLPPARLLDGKQAAGDSSYPGQPPPSTVHRPPSYKVVANLPYAITAPVLRHFLEGDPVPELMVVLVQWEVAERIIARGSGDTPRYSVLAHSVQLYAEPEIVARVPASSFLPAPAVDSAVLCMRRRPTLAVAVEDVDGLFRVIKAGFLQARKKLGNALPGGLAAMGVKLDRQVALTALAAAGISPDRRAETLTLAEWAALYQTLKS